MENRVISSESVSRATTQHGNSTARHWSEEGKSVASGDTSTLRSLQRCLQCQECGDNLGAHQWMNGGERKCATYI